MMARGQSMVGALVAGLGLGQGVLGAGVRGRRGAADDTPPEADFTGYQVCKVRSLYPLSFPTEG